MESEKITFRQVTEQWMQTKAHRVKASTRSRYLFLLERHVYPVLGNCPMEEVNVEMISNFLQQKMQQGNLRDGSPLSSKTICDIRTLILEIMKYAVRKELCSTYLDDIFCPKSNEKLITVFSMDEQHQLMLYLDDHSGPVKLGIMLSLFGGLRIGEVCALTWGDINLPKQSITVSKTINRIKTMKEEGEDSPKTVIQVTTPKTHHSKRDIPIAACLKDILAKNKPADSDTGTYILTGSSKPMEPRLLLKRYKTVLKKAGLPEYTFHTLRHYVELYIMPQM